MISRLPALVGLPLVLASVLFAAPTPTSENRPVPGLSRAIVISIDGLRPDLLLRARTPALQRLMKRGSYSMWARTTPVAVTLPSHTSMLTGTIPSRHRIEWNSDLPLSNPIYPSKPTLFELAHKAGYTTGMAVGKSKLSPLAVPGMLDWTFLPAGAVATDDAVTDTTVRWIKTGAPEVLFVHLPGVDVVGHEYGWGSKEQIEAIEDADQCVARILDALRRRRLLDATLVLISADHGGAGRSHGPDDPRSRTIPWIAAGPGLRQDFDLTRDANLEIRTEDTFATVCWILGINPPSPVDGRPVTQILPSTQ